MEFACDGPGGVISFTFMYFLSPIVLSLLFWLILRLANKLRKKQIKKNGTVND